MYTQMCPELAALSQDTELDIIVNSSLKRSAQYMGAAEKAN